MTHNPLLPPPPPPDRERVNLSGPEWWVGKSCPSRVIQSNYPPSVFANNGLRPPPAPTSLALSSFVLPGHWVSMARLRSAAASCSTATVVFFFPEASRGSGRVSGDAIQADSVSFFFFFCFVFSTPRTQTRSAHRKKKGENQVATRGSRSGRGTYAWIYDHSAVTCIPFHTWTFLRNCL